MVHTTGWLRKSAISAPSLQIWHQMVHTTGWLRKSVISSPSLYGTKWSTGWLVTVIFFNLVYNYGSKWSKLKTDQWKILFLLCSYWATNWGIVFWVTWRSLRAPSIRCSTLKRMASINYSFNKSGLFSCPAILPYGHNVILSLCHSAWRTVYLPVCLTDFLPSCWHSEQLLFW